MVKCESFVKLNVDRNRVIRKTWNGAEQGKVELTFTAWKWWLVTRHSLQMWAVIGSVISVCYSVQRRKDTPVKQAASYHALHNKFSYRLHNLALHLPSCSFSHVYFSGCWSNVTFFTCLVSPFEGGRGTGFWDNRMSVFCVSLHSNLWTSWPIFTEHSMLAITMGDIQNPCL